MQTDHRIKRPIRRVKKPQGIDMKYFGLWLSAPEHAALVTAAKDRKTTIAALIRQCLANSDIITLSAPESGEVPTRQST